MKNFKKFLATFLVLALAITGFGFSAQPSVKSQAALKITNQAAVSSWRSGVNYRVGDLVTYGGQTYKCLIAHTSHDGWKPSSATYSVWQKVSSSSTITATPKPTSRPTATTKPTFIASPTSAPSTSTGKFVQNFDKSITTSSTAKSTTDGAWSTAVSSSTGKHITKFTRSTSIGYSNKTSLECTVGSGRYTINFYLGFSKADADKGLTFKTYVPSGSHIDKIDKITVNGKTILSETKLTAGSWNTIKTSALGRTSGYIEFEYHSPSTTNSRQKIYIDDIEQIGASSTPAPTVKPTAAPTAKPTTAPTQKPTAVPTQRPVATATPVPTQRPTTTSSGYYNIGYLPYYRCEDSSYKNIDYSALSHICLAFFNVSGSKSSFSIKNGFGSNLANVVKYVKEQNGVKLLASYGGESTDSSLYSSIFKDSTSRAKLVSLMVENAKSNKLDGIDIDLEASEISNFDTFIAELRKKCDDNGLLLSTATAPWISDSLTSTTLKSFDFINIMAYDNEDERNHSSYEYAVELMNHYTKRGVSASKLIMGVPFYARTEYSHSDPEASYSEIVGSSSSNADVDSAKYNGRTFYYNGRKTIAKKCELVKSNKLGGIMIWDLGQDTTNSYSLLKVIKETLYGSNGKAPR